MIIFNFRSGDKQKCSDYAKKVLELNENFIKALFIIGVQKQDLEGIDKALVYQLELLAKFPNFINLYINIGYLYGL